VVEHKLRGYQERLLKIDLAKGDLSQEKLAAKYGVTGPAIHHFKTRHAAAIAEIKAQIDEGVRAEIVGLWIADKANRIAEYQKDVELLTEQVVDGSLEPQDFRGAMKVKQAALRNVAEELGELKVQVETDGTVKYIVEGVNPEDLT
jgi:hypothetical protein